MSAVGGGERQTTSPTLAAEELIDLGDWVPVPMSGRLRGRGSGVEVHVVETYAVKLRDGRIVRVEEYRTTEQALKAVQGARSE